MSEQVKIALSWEGKYGLVIPLNKVFKTN